MSVRVRFAPSPTGYLHIGGARTALFNYLFAKHNSGKFLLRIEDTDLERSKPEFAQAILDSFDWLGMPSDEPVVIQSSRFGEHKKLLDLLVAQGKAYFCSCTENVLESMKEAQIAAGLTPQYDGRCRAAPQDPTKPCALRFKLPFTSGPITFDDLVHGPITIDASVLDDFVIARSDGVPMYNFVVVADDAFMKISHIIRGEEHIPNTPKQILLYQAFGYQVPRFAHIPMILGPGGEKLSKRDGAVAVTDFRTMGYLPDALINYLVRLGWAHGDQEIFTRAELINFFSLEHVNKSGAVFDQTKLDWVNGVYLKDADNQYLLDTITKSVEPGFDAKPEIIALYKSRVKTLRQLVDEIRALQNPPTPTETELAPWKNEQTVQVLTKFLVGFASSTDFPSLGKQVCDSLHIKMPALAQPVRLALTGKVQAPGIYELIAVLGVEESAKRIEKFIACLRP